MIINDKVLLLLELGLLPGDSSLRLLHSLSQVGILKKLTLGHKTVYFLFLEN